MASICEKYLRAYHNEGFYEFGLNGEQFAMRTFARWAAGKPVVVWDVGAHEGNWANTCHALLPQAHIYSFEILHPIFERLSKEQAGKAWWTVRNVGLSDAAGGIDVTWNQDHDTTNAIAPRLDTKWFAGGNLSTLQCKVTTLTDLLADGIPEPTFLKIDVEGHELPVLRGGLDLLASPTAPVPIQFEYGDTWISSRTFLADAHALLTERGYTVGRLHASHVNFKPYESTDEHFRMGNMIAVKNDGLQTMLAN